MVVLSRCLPFLVAMVPFALASSTPEADKLESLRPVQRVMQVDFEEMRDDFENMRDALRARPSFGDLPPNRPVRDPLCSKAEPCADNCIHDPPCPRNPLSRDRYWDLCRIVGCSARNLKGAPLCAVGQCDGNCICREEIFTKLNVLLINDALGELFDKAEETKGKDEL